MRHFLQDSTSLRQSPGSAVVFDGCIPEDVVRSFGLVQQALEAHPACMARWGLLGVDDCWSLSDDDWMMNSQHK
jgi:hypothetical protein